METLCDDDRASRGARYTARDAAPDLASARADDDEPGTAIARDISDAPPRRALEDLALGIHTGGCGSLERPVEDAPPSRLTRRQPALIHGSAEDAGAGRRDEPILADAGRVVLRPALAWSPGFAEMGSPPDTGRDRTG
jgi:hypothetical protein